MRVSLAQPRDPRMPTERRDEPAALVLADPRGPRVVLGGLERDVAAPIAPLASTLFAPRGAALAGPHGPLVVADTGHHRILIWNEVPTADGTAADVVVGQPGFAAEARNAGGAVTATTCNVPVGVATRGGMLAVADSWNHRVLLWHRMPRRSNAAPDVILGQGRRDAGLFNRGGGPGADTLYWCSGVAFTKRGLLVADTGNRRVLVWDAVPERDGAPADRVLGQTRFDVRDENGGGPCGAAGMRWPHDLLESDGHLVVADAGNNRLMVWHGMPETNGAACDAILGQRDATSGDHNGGTYWPTSSTLNMPYGCAIAGDMLIVADTANSRLIGWHRSELRANARACGLVAQPDFSAKGDNRWQFAVRDSLCWPYGISACGDTLVIADSGNSRVALWDLA